MIALVPETASLPDGSSLPVDAVVPGTVVAVRPGAKVPIDGEVVKGRSTVDEASVTGESRPVKKAVGSEVLAGTVNQQGYLEVRTTRRSGDSTAARLVRLIQDAQAQRSPTELIVDRFATIYTPIMVIASLLMASVPWAVVDTTEKGLKWVYLALVLLVTACPCALVISTPITYVCALALSARQGILVKGGKHLEALGKLKVLAIDKTGTLTEGRFRLTHLISLDVLAYPRQSVLSLVAALENCSSHPLASAIVYSAKAEGVSIASNNVEEYTTIAGEGLAGIVDGKKVQVGNRRLASRMGWLPAEDACVKAAPASGNAFTLALHASKGGTSAMTSASGAEGIEGLRAAAAEWEEQAETVCFVGVDGALVAVLGVADRVRAEAKEAVALLQSRGLKLVMLTGDNEGTARAVQQQLGLQHVQANLLPEDKVSAVARLKEELAAMHGGATVGMVGDGINDAPALRRADVGVAMGAGGTAAAIESADVALMDSSLLSLAAAVELGVRCRAVITQNVMLSLIAKVTMIVLAVLGYAPLWLAVVADVGTMLIVCANGMKILDSGETRKRKKGHKHGHRGISRLCCCLIRDSDGHRKLPTDDEDLHHGHGRASTAGHGHGHGHGGLSALL